MLVWLWVVQGSYVEAVAQMRGCLQSLGRPLPTTKLDLVSSLFWSVVRQLLHRAALCRVLEWRAVTLRRCSSAADIQLSARDATLVYHKLLQLHLTGSTPTSSSSSSTYSPSSTTSCCSSSISPVAHPLPPALILTVNRLSIFPQTLKILQQPCKVYTLYGRLPFIFRNFTQIW